MTDVHTRKSNLRRSAVGRQPISTHLSMASRWLDRAQPRQAARYPDVPGTKITRRRAEVYLDTARRIVRWVRRQMV